MRRPPIDAWSPASEVDGAVRPPLVVPRPPDALTTLRIFLQPLLHLALLAAGVLFFCDEVIRRALPGTPVLVTAIKDGLLFASGFLALVIAPGSRRIASLLLPWSVFTFISSLYVLDHTGNWTHATGVWRTYTFSFLYLPVGFYIAEQASIRRTLTRLFSVGCVITVVLAIMQEHARSALPAVLSDRIYKTAHSLAGGEYNEGPFASPTVLAVVMVTTLMFVLAELSREQRRVHAWWFGFVVLLLYSIYLTRTRIAVVFVLFGAGLLAVTSPPSVRVVKRWVSYSLIGGLFAIAGLATVLLSEVELRVGSPTTSYEQDLAFYSWLLDPDELVARLFIFTREIGWTEPRNVLLGYGTGVSGSLVRLLSPPPNAPMTHDTGLFLLYVEVGVTGMFVFAVTYLRAAWLCARVGLRPTAASTTRAAAVATSYIPLWFLLKNHPLIANGATHALWLVATGYVLAHARVSDVRREDLRLPLRRPVPVPARRTGSAGI